MWFKCTGRSWSVQQTAQLSCPSHRGVGKKSTSSLPVSRPPTGNRGVTIEWTSCSIRPLASRRVQARPAITVGRVFVCPRTSERDSSRFCFFFTVRSGSVRPVSFLYSGNIVGSRRARTCAAIGRKNGSVLIRRARSRETRREENKIFKNIRTPPPPKRRLRRNRGGKQNDSVERRRRRQCLKRGDGRRRRRRRVRARQSHREGTTVIL